MKRENSKKKKLRDLDYERKYYLMEHEPPSKHAMEHFKWKPDYKIHNGKEK